MLDIHVVTQQFKLMLRTQVLLKLLLVTVPHPQLCIRKTLLQIHLHVCYFQEMVLIQVGIHFLQNADTECNWVWVQYHCRTC